MFIHFCFNVLQQIPDLKMMSLCKKSKESVDKNAEVWSKNFPPASKKLQRCSKIVLVDKNLVEFVRLPLKKDILGRIKFLYQEIKEKDVRINHVKEELFQLWSKFSFPTVSNQVVTAKIKKLLDQHDRNRKRSNGAFQNQLSAIFDITKTEGLWLCREDKDLYLKQLETGGNVGYRTDKVAPSSSVHPSRRKYCRLEVQGTKRHSVEGCDHSENVRISDDENVSSSSVKRSDDEDSTSSSSSSLSSSLSRTVNKRKLRSLTKPASKLVTKHGLSTRKAYVVCESLATSGVKLPTPSQSGIWRRVIKDGQVMTNKIKEILLVEKNFCLNFDGKRMDGHEYQVVSIQSPERHIKLGISKCASGSSKHIYDGIKSLLDEYDAWSSIQMIVCDTTPVNTGRLNGVVVQIQKEVMKKGFPEPQYIGCQHHILDRILKHVLDFFIETQSRKPSINYEFIDEVLQKYADLQQNYRGELHLAKSENPGWRNDFKFLFELCTAFRFYKEKNKLPFIKWRQLPSLNAARWNSRAIYCFIAYFLLPNWRKKLETIVNFLANEWQKAWFSGQVFSEESTAFLSSAIHNLKCPQAIRCFETHWSQEPSRIDVPRTNIIAERNVKLMEELHEHCRSDKYLNLKFLATNSL